MSDRTEVGRVQCTQVKVEKVKTRLVTVRNTMHAQSNFFIKQSRCYFPNEKMPAYIDFPFLLGTARVMFVASLFGALVLSGGAKEIPLFFFAVCLLFFLIFSQHEWVNQTSILVVFKQPVLANQRLWNDFYELTVTELDGVSLQNYQAGVGFIQMSQGKVRIQAFNKRGRKYMTDARCHSRIMLVLFTMALAYNCNFMALAYSR